MIHKFERMLSLLKKGAFFELFHRSISKIVPSTFFLMGKANVLMFEGDKIELRRRHSKVEFRQANFDDLEAILECHGSRLNGELYKSFFSEGGMCYVLLLDTKVIGYNWVFLNSYPITFDRYKTSRIELILDKKSAFLANGFIRPEKRLGGFFPVLISDIVAEINNRFNIKTFMAHVSYSNLHSLKSQMKLGFQVVGVLYYCSLLGKGMTIFRGKNMRLRFCRHQWDGLTLRVSLPEQPLL